MYDLTTIDWLEEIKEHCFGAKVTVEDALGNKLYFKLKDIEIAFSNSPYELPETTIHAYYEGKEMQTEMR